MPTREQDWIDIANEFETLWNFPNCIGAIDGKHVNIKCPVKSGSYYFNYKGSFSIVLLTLVDADYKFRYIDVGCNGRISDGGVFRNSSLSNALEKNLLNIPEPRMMADAQLTLPYTVVADDAFPLKSYIMKPYPSRNLTIEQLIFNYRLSRARRIVENAFGILANRFRVFLSPILLSPVNAEKVVLCSCALHNYLRIKSPTRYTPPGSLDMEMDDGTTRPGDWRSEGVMTPLGQQCGNRYTYDAKEIRELFCNYFNNHGQVPWQNKFI